jgi:hypothetical protein
MRQISHPKLTEISVKVRKHSAECHAVRRISMVLEPDAERGGLASRTARDSKRGRAEFKSMRHIKTEASVFSLINDDIGLIYDNTII